MDIRYVARSLPVCAILLLSSLVVLTLTPAAAVLAPPTATPALAPDPAYGDTLLTGSASYNDADGNPEGESSYRWLVNGLPIEASTVAQSLLLPLDGDADSVDGQAPAQATGLTFTDGRFGQGVALSETAGSRLAYATEGNADPREGSFEVWLRLGHDLDDPAYDSYQRLFAYDIDSEHKLYVEINADRIVVGSRHEGSYYGTWPAPPGWRAGEWHHIAATWSSSANHSAIYYDGVLADEGSHPPLVGTAATFNLGSSWWGGVLTATLDDVRLSRRALSSAEVAAAYQRDAPAPNDEAILAPNRFGQGDTVAFELTPCDTMAECGAPVTATVAILKPPLGRLSPARGLLTPGTLSTTLSLTTSLSASCRWSSQPDTAYTDMSHDFTAGQGTISHTTLVTGLTDLNRYHFYVRCADAIGSPRDPDDYERWTHVRVIGPTGEEYPRIGLLWSGYSPSRGPTFYARYDLFVPSWWEGGVVEADAIRTVNPRAKILMAQDATYGYIAWDNQAKEWYECEPGDPGYACLLRDTAGDVLFVPYWDHPMYNMTAPYCRDVLAGTNISAFLSLETSLGADLAYDGIFWDRLHNDISWLGDDLGSGLVDMDSDLDGQPDVAATLDAAYKAGMIDFFTQIRTALPHVVLMGNDAPLDYAPWLNGRFYEVHVPQLLRGVDWLTWEEVTTNYRDWSRLGRPPQTTLMENSPQDLYSDKYTFRHLDEMSAAMEEEAASGYRRVRFGLATALMGEGIYTYNYGPDWHGSLWWYDEYGAAAGHTGIATLPAQGYLGQPRSTPFLLIDSLDTPNPLLNGNFEEGLTPWGWWVDTASGTEADLSLDGSGGVSGTAAAHVVVTATGHVELSQGPITLTVDRQHTLSFWARSSSTRTIGAYIGQNASPWTYYGFWGEVEVTPEWQRLVIEDDLAYSRAVVTDARLTLELGDAVGDIWIDQVALQEGELGVWARRFDGGLAVVNSTGEVQTAALSETYCELQGGQAPLLQHRVDNEGARSSAGWAEEDASYDQFGETVLSAPGGSLATAIYSPTLAYSGSYEVLAWVTPTATQSASVSVTIQHADGRSSVLLDQATGELGWRSLGNYPFAADAAASATIVATGDGTVIADAIKWVSLERYNRGQSLQGVTLQPLDGRILLSDCHAAPEVILLPLLLRDHTSS